MIPLYVILYQLESCGDKYSSCPDYISKYLLRILAQEFLMYDHTGKICKASRAKKLIHIDVASYSVCTLLFNWFVF